MDAAEAARRTRSARAYKGLKQEELAEAIGVHVQSIKRYENEEDETSVPDEGRRLAIAEACGLPGWFDETETGRPAPHLQGQLDRIEAQVSQIPEGLEMLRTLVTPGILDKALEVLREAQERAQPSNSKHGKRPAK